MPSRKPKSADPAAEPATEPTAPAAEPVDAEATAPEGTATEDDAPIPMNRAERRAKGKGGIGVQPNRMNLPGKGNTIQAPRQWTKRRGG